MLKECVRGVQKGFGDCDDSVTLFCNCLEAVGIHTAVIELPNHVLMVFTTNVTMEAIPSEIYEHPEKKIYEHFQWISRPEYSEGKPIAWIPVETTLIEAGFDAAWKEALKVLRERAEDVGDEGLTCQPVHLQGEAWEIYQPVNVPYDVKEIQQEVLEKLQKVLEGLQEDEIMKEDMKEIQWFTFQP
jgi:hypothetical protein